MLARYILNAREVSAGIDVSASGLHLLSCSPGQLAKTIICEILSLPFFDGLQNEPGNEFGPVVIGVIG